MSGGYAKAPTETAAMSGPYKVVGEALETFASVISGLQIDEERLLSGVSKDGRRYHSSVPVRQ